MEHIAANHDRCPIHIALSLPPMPESDDSCFFFRKGFRWSKRLKVMGWVNVIQGSSHLLVIFSVRAISLNSIKSGMMCKAFIWSWKSRKSSSAFFWPEKLGYELNVFHLSIMGSWVWIQIKVFKFNVSLPQLFSVQTSGVIRNVHVRASDCIRNEHIWVFRWAPILEFYYCLVYHAMNHFWPIF